VAWQPFRNLGLKLLSLLLATAIWMAVTRDQLVERSLRVPIEFQNVPANLEITGNPPTAVDVRVRGPSSILGRLEPGEVVAVLDLRGARPGQRLFHLLTDEVRVPFGTEVAQVTPPTVALTFERSGSRTVPVVPAIEGDPAPGYIAGQVTVDPPAVEVVGPVSRLNALREATTEPVSIENARAPVRDNVTIGAMDAAVRLREPRSATVTVRILPAPIERAVRDVPVRARHLGRSLRVSIEPTRVTVMLRGPREALGALSVGDLEAWVDAASLGPGRYNLPVRFDQEKDYAIAHAEPASVQVRIR
jgi:YbbR domain-containing protein